MSEKGWGPPAGALSGLRVLDTATLYAAPFIATLLADQGADVVKVEPPEGDDYRHQPARMWPLLARGKRSVALDLRDPAGVEALLGLVAQCDVVVLNMPPATLAKRGLDHETLLARNPEVIIAQVTGFGLEGPYVDRPGNGTLAEATAGLTHMTGEPDGAPVLASVPLGDAITGFAGAFAVLAACYHRLAHGGGGQVIDVNPVEVLLHAVGPMVTDNRPGEPVPGRLGSRLKGSVVRNVFATADGRWVAISLSTPRHVADAATLVGHDADAEAGPGGDLEAAVRAWASGLTRAEVLEALGAARLPGAPVNTARDVRADPHLVARSSVRPITTTEQGVVDSPAPAPRLLGTPGRPVERTPGLDEHAAEVLGPDGWRPPHER